MTTTKEASSTPARNSAGFPDRFIQKGPVHKAKAKLLYVPVLFFSLKERASSVRCLNPSFRFFFTALLPFHRLLLFSYTVSSSSSGCAARTSLPDIGGSALPACHLKPVSSHTRYGLFLPWTGGDPKYTAG